uniref:ORF present in extra-plastid DNA segment n=1 Tax=Lobelia pyramidalis TaxID=3041678 RepID=UPI002551DE0B|nr:ORF present in extra-plastid DNA segment [Lobelia pyramidalis]WGH11450.1 ORF present in extra-plastid DNA segment [Lobelia pyramidalis]
MDMDQNCSRPNKEVGPKCRCYYCRTYVSRNSPKDYYSLDYNLKEKKEKGGINGKRFPELEKESLFPQTEETGRKFLSARKKHEPALTCPHGKKYHGYKHSYNKGHCYTYSNETDKIFLEAFQSGSGAGERWINQKIQRLSKNRKALEAFQANIKSLLTEAAKKPKTELNARKLGFWHGALLRLDRLSPEDFKK